jgi:hypothetical protein
VVWLWIDGNRLAAREAVFIRDLILTLSE